MVAASIRPFLIASKTAFSFPVPGRRVGIPVAAAAKDAGQIAANITARARPYPGSLRAVLSVDSKDLRIP